MFNTRPISIHAAGFCFALGSAILFAVRPVFVKLVYAEGTDPTTLIAFRMLFSLPMFVFFTLWLLKDPELKARLTRKNVIQTGLVGCIGYYVSSYLDLIGLQYVTAQLGRMVLYIYPTFVVIFGALLFNNRITMKTMVSLLITYTGVLIIFGHDLNEFGSHVIKGSTYILICAASFSFYLLLSKSLIDEMGSRLFTSIALSSASVAILIHYFVISTFSERVPGSFFAPNANSTSLFWIFIIALFCTVIPSFFTTAAVARIGSGKTGIVATIGPGFTSLAAVLVLSEKFTLYHLLGIFFTIAGIWLLSREKPQ